MQSLNIQIFLLVWFFGIIKHDTVRNTNKTSFQFIINRINVVFLNANVNRSTMLGYKKTEFRSERYYLYRKLRFIWCYRNQGEE